MQHLPRPGRGRGPRTRNNEMPTETYPYIQFVIGAVMLGYLFFG